MALRLWCCGLCCCVGCVLLCVVWCCVFVFASVVVLRLCCWVVVCCAVTLCFVVVGVLLIVWLRSVLCGVGVMVCGVVCVA